MDKLGAMQIFSAVAETQSFAAGARKLGLSPPAVTRAVAALEEHLGVRLFVRTTRSVRLTEAGQRYQEDCRRILTEITEAEDAVVGLHRMPKGQLNITASVMFGQQYVAPLLLEFLDRYPEVNARAVFLDRVVNLIDEGLDLAVRIGELPDSSLIAIRVGQVHRVVCGAPAYFARHGQPSHPWELTQHRVVTASGGPQTTEWIFREQGQNLPVKVTPQLVVNTNTAAIDAALRGWGLSRRLSYQVAQPLAEGRLLRVLREFEPPPLPIHVVHQQGRRVSVRVRAFVDFLVERLRADSTIQ